MKKIIFVFLLVFSFAKFDASERKSDVKKYYKTSVNLNVRTGAGKKYPVSFTLKKGDQVELISKNKSWSEVKYLDKTGFVTSKYLIQSEILSGKALLKKNVIFSYFIISIVGLFFLVIIFKICRKIHAVIIKRKDKKLLQTVTTLDRGTWSERDLALRFLKYGISEHNIFHDLYVSKGNGNFSQIDLAIITQVGIIVFEVKDYSGWIYGNGNYTRWIQSFSNNKKYYFYNPIKQNNKHIEDLKKQVNYFENLPFFSVIVFYGNCKLKDINFVPDGTFITKAERVFEIVKLILKNNIQIKYSNIERVLYVFNESKKNGEDYDIQKQHRDSIQDMLGNHRVFD